MVYETFSTQENKAVKQHMFLVCVYCTNHIKTLNPKNKAVRQHMFIVCVYCTNHRKTLNLNLQIR